MYITLPLICLCNKQIRHMSTNMVLIARSIATEDFLQSALMISSEPGK